MSYQFTLSEAGDQLDIVVDNPKFDAAGIDAFKEELEQVWSGSITKVIIDFSSVQFIDSSGVGALLSVQKKMPPKCEPVTLRGAKPNVVSVIELLRLHRVFKLD